MLSISRAKVCRIHRRIDSLLFNAQLHCDDDPVLNHGEKIANFSHHLIRLRQHVTGKHGAQPKLAVSDDTDILLGQALQTFQTVSFIRDGSQAGVEPLLCNAPSVLTPNPSWLESENGCSRL